MVYLYSIIAGLVLSVFANYILDYLPYQRGITGKQIRLIRFFSSGKDTSNSIIFSELPSEKKIFTSVNFPFCPTCKENKSWPDYLIGKKCNHCGAVAAMRFWILTIGMPAIFLFFAINPVRDIRIVDLFLLITFYSIIFFMDIEHRVILMPVTLAGILFGVYFGFSYHSLINTIFGAIAGGGIMLMFYWLGILYIRFVRKVSDPNMYEVALGFGDVTLSFTLGLILGWPGIMGGLFFGILLGGGISGGLLLVKLLTKKYAPNDMILPYAPFLVIGAFIIMIL